MSAPAPPLFLLQRPAKMPLCVALGGHNTRTHSCPGLPYGAMARRMRGPNPRCQTRPIAASNVAGSAIRPQSLITRNILAQNQTTSEPQPTGLQPPPADPVVAAVASASLAAAGIGMPLGRNSALAIAAATVAVASARNPASPPQPQLADSPFAPSSSSSPSPPPPATSSSPMEGAPVPWASLGPSLDLIAQRLRVGSSTIFTLLAPRDVDAVMDMYLDKGLLDADPYWTRAWPSAIALASTLLARPELVRGKVVADLGAGLGLAGMAAAMAGAKEVVLLDREPLALQCALLSAAASGLDAGLYDNTLSAADDDGDDDIIHTTSRSSSSDNDSSIKTSSSLSSGAALEAPSPSGRHVIEMLPADQRPSYCTLQLTPPYRQMASTSGLMPPALVHTGAGGVEDAGEEAVRPPPSLSTSPSEQHQHHQHQHQHQQHPQGVVTAVCRGSEEIKLSDQLQSHPQSQWRTGCLREEDPAAAEAAAAAAAAAAAEWRMLLSLARQHYRGRAGAGEGCVAATGEREESDSEVAGVSMDGDPESMLKGMVMPANNGGSWGSEGGHSESGSSGSSSNNSSGASVGGARGVFRAHVFDWTAPPDMARLLPPRNQLSVSPAQPPPTATTELPKHQQLTGRQLQQGASRAPVRQPGVRQRRFDVLLACDVLYEDVAVGPIAGLMPLLLEPAGGRLLLADPPNRTVRNRERFLSEVRSGSLRLVLEECSLQQCEVSKLDNEMAGGLAPSTESVPVQFLVFRSCVGNDTVGLKM